MPGNPRQARHRDAPPQRPARFTGAVRAGALATVLVVGLLAVVHWGLSGSDCGATPADAAIAPAHGSTTTGHHALRASAVKDG